MEHARHCLPGALHRLQSLPGHLDDKLVAACRPLDSRDAPDVAFALVFQLLENVEELAGDLELVVVVKPDASHMDVAQFGCDQVLHHTHVLFVVVGNTPLSGPSAHGLAVLALPGCTSHQNVGAYREMYQRLAVTDARSVVTTIGVGALQHLCQKLLLDVHQKSRQLFQPGFVGWAKLKPLVAPLGKSSKGRTRVTPHHDVVRGLCSRFRHAVCNAHCTVGSTTTHSLSCAPPR